MTCLLGLPNITPNRAAHPEPPTTGDPAMPADRLHPNDVTAYLNEGGTYSAILALPDLELEALAKALTGALTVARNAICLREVRGEAS